MVTEFAFDTHFFDSKSLTTAGQSAVHDSILQMWRDYGVLVLNAKKFDTTLDLIKKISDQIPTALERSSRIQPYFDNRKRLGRFL
ncbi:hypothetical protein PSE10A_11200 [Pseudomonas amygdali pv. eriobotryae]|uniref:Uncharacterized protein n=1 Tax=Pseudomonas amygdali pv. eriobotryae TaxID=129137 RepID=A0A9P3EB44_PSEA0|nr:hypothetical protein PSE10A_11200 [Pseudomonas amygdali pv. eriobotryae]